MTRKKLTDQDVEKIIKMLKAGHTRKEVAALYNVDPSTIQYRCKALGTARRIPLKKKQELRRLVEQGYSKAEAAQVVGINIGTAIYLLKDLEGHRSQGNHVIRPQAIKLLNRLLTDGYLIDDFIMETAHRLQEHFPSIQSARYKQKTFFYLLGKEKETIEAYFRLKPDRVISYHTLQEISYLLGMKMSKAEKKEIYDKHKGRHDEYWKSRHITQRSLDDWIDDSKPKEPEISFRLMPRKSL